MSHDSREHLTTFSFLPTFTLKLDADLIFLIKFSTPLLKHRVDETRARSHWCVDLWKRSKTPDAPYKATASMWTDYETAAWVGSEGKSFMLRSTILTLILKEKFELKVEIHFLFLLLHWIQSNLILKLEISLVTFFLLRMPSSFTSNNFYCNY